MSKNSGNVAKLTPNEKFAFYCDHDDMAIEVLMSKLSLSKRSIRGYKTRAKKLHKGKKFDIETDDVKITKPDSITEDFYEQYLINLVMSAKPDLRFAIEMRNYLDKKGKIINDEEDEMGDYDGEDQVETIILKD